MAQQPIEVAEVDVTAAVEGVLGRMRPKLAATQTTVELALEDLPTAVPTDPTMLDTCLRHLLGNAAKFVSSDRQPIVTVSGAVGDDWIGVTVADNGIGVAEEDADRMFDMFSRLNGREAFDGHGIGLGIVSLVVDRLGGQLTVESVLGEGTRMTIRLPRQGPPTEPSDTG